MEMSPDLINKQIVQFLNTCHNQQEKLWLVLARVEVSLV